MVLKNALLAALLVSAPAAFAHEMIEFHIAPGTAKSPWNTPETTVQVHVGDVLRIINDDSIVHQLHTNGVPCAHGPAMKPGAYYDCEIAATYNRDADGPLYEHNVGPKAAFYLNAAEE